MPRNFAFVIVPVFALAVLGPGATLAADPKADAALKAFEQIGADAAKLPTYCALAQLMDETSNDDKKAAAADAQIDAYVKILGPEFDAAMLALQSFEETSADGKALDAALDELDQKCPK